MDNIKHKLKKNMLMNTLKSCKSLSSSSSKSWQGIIGFSSNHKQEKNKNRKQIHKVAPEGYFSVYVGPEKQRFVVKAEFANHPLFKMLLEQAESEYGFDSDGPILLPCDVDLFHKVLGEMDSCNEIASPSCSLVVLHSPCTPTCLARKLYGNGAYMLLSPQRTLKLNKF